MKKISPEIGEINLGKHNIIISYYEQNQAQALPLEERVIDLICHKSPEWSQKKVRTFLGGFGFQNETVFKFIKQLSGGEKARLALALMIWFRVIFCYWMNQLIIWIFNLKKI